jgi:small conductance mechanosensitive channel
LNLLHEFFAGTEWQAFVFSGLRVLLLLVAFWLVLRLAKVGLGKLEDALVQRGQADGEPPSEVEKRAQTLVGLVRQAIVIVISVVFMLVILRELGVQIGPILASAGIVGLAIGFGAQNLVRDVISGFFLILENQVRIGDVAVVNGTGGLVERINFRTIVLRDLSGTVHSFPNGTITTLANVTRDWSAYVFDIGVAYKEDVDRVMEIMKSVGVDLRADDKFGPLMIDDVEIFGVDNFADSAVVIKGRVRTKPIQQWTVGREYRRRLKKRFDQEGVEIPFPHRSINFGVGSDPLLDRLTHEPTGEVVKSANNA